MIRWRTGSETADALWEVSSTSLRSIPLCPDLLRYEEIGAADNIRGRIVLAFFWLIRWWRP